ncbi:MAG: hypothetical protein IT328_05965 [Caldilineaceae bacterium]|nr:hypothetical protein [Caldilineaceae bacterium]
MTDRPIIFSAEMVRAILEGRKTQTRRVIKPQPDHFHKFSDGILRPQIGLREIECLYKPGMTLWVREAFTGDWRGNGQPSPTFINYRADSEIPEQYSSNAYWRSPIHMPRWASRITLEVVSVRVERVQDISDDDAVEEGVDRTNTSIPTYAIQRYRKLWDTINAKRGYSWESNPWVWAITFRRLEPTNAT